MYWATFPPNLLTVSSAQFEYAAKTSRRSSGSMPVESAVDPTRSANITVTWRRSAPSRGGDPEAAGGCDLGARSAIKRKIRRRSPSNTPSSLRSSSVRSGRIERSILFSAKRSAYPDKPCEPSHSLIPGIRLSAASRLSPDLGPSGATRSQVTLRRPAKSICTQMVPPDLSEREYPIITLANGHNCHYASRRTR